MASMSTSEYASQSPPRQGAKQPQAASPVLNDQLFRFLLQFRKALFKFVLPQLCQ
jgi:hypothetical protein